MNFKTSSVFRERRGWQFGSGSQEQEKCLIATLSGWRVRQQYLWRISVLIEKTVKGKFTEEDEIETILLKMDQPIQGSQLKDIQELGSGDMKLPLITEPKKEGSL